MSSEKTLKEVLFDLKLQLDQLDKRLVELQEKRNNTHNALNLLQNQYGVSNNLIVSEQHTNKYSSHRSCVDVAYEYLTEQKRICSTREIADAVYSRGVKTTPESLMSTTSTALRRLCEQNKIKKIKKGFWELLEKVTDVSNEHEQP